MNDNNKKVDTYHADKNNGLKVAKYISFSGGVESSTMAILYGKGAKLIWVDTGAEHKEMYRRLDMFEKFIIDFHKGDCQLIRLKGDYPHKGERLNSLWATILTIMFMPSIFKRYCTTYFKIKPIDKFLSTQGEVELLIGFNADEEPGKDRTGNLMKCKNVKYSYPLFDDGYTREDCEAILEFHGVLPSFPVYMSRGGCKMCFFKSEKEYKAMYYLDRETFNEVKGLEKSIQDKRKKFFSVLPSGKSMQQIENECRDEIPFNYSEIYKEVGKKVYCGAMCHR